MESIADKPSESSSSQNTWAEEEGGISNATDIRPDPAESYDENSSDNPAQNVTTAARDRANNSVSPSCSSVLKYVWQTNMTENTAHNRELYLKLTLRELIIFILFLINLCIITFGMMSVNMYYFTNIMQRIFIQTPFGPSSITFSDISNVDDYWNYVQGPFLKGLYQEAWYNGENFTSEEQGFIYYENKLLGVPRFRSLRVRNDSCVVPGDFQEDISICYNEYSSTSEDRLPFGLMNGTAWIYHTASQLGGSSYKAQVSTYGAGGYVQDLNTTSVASEHLINELIQNKWIDRGSRVVFIDFTVYNANINLFCVIKLIVEFPATGGALASAVFNTVKLIRYVTSFDYFISACEILFILFTIYYIIEEILEITKHRLSYFKTFWNVLDVLILPLAVCVIIFSIYRTVTVNLLLAELLAKPNSFADFSTLAYWQFVFNILIAVMTFVSWLKLFKFISFNSTMNQLSSTLSRCAKDIAGYSLMFFIVFFAFAQLGYLLFGSQLGDFCTFGDSIFTLFRIVLGDFDFVALQTANRVLGPLFFVCYVFFIYFVLMNMFLAIINDTYSDVKDELAVQKNNLEMTDYLKQKYNRLVKRLREKKQKNEIAQKVMRTPDATRADNMVDVDEWKRGLKSQGFTDGELDAACSRYDVDGNHMIDKKELIKLSRELQKKQTLEDSDDEDSDEDERSGHTKSSRSGRPAGAVGGVSNEEFSVLTRRVDRMEHSIGSIVSKIDAVLVKLEAMERSKAKRRETMNRILDSITESDGRTDETRRAEMERHVREELERWDSESSLGVASGRGISPGSADRHGPGIGTRSRPTSLHIDSNV